MAKSDIPHVTIRDAEFRYLNFEGREGAYNDKGKRNFQIILPEDLAAKMADDGWAIKKTRPSRAQAEDADFVAQFEPRPYIDVAISFKYESKAPQIYLVTTVKTLLGEETALLVDQSDIQKMDVVLEPSVWNVNGKSGVKAYIKQAFVVINETDLELEYNHIPTAGTTIVGESSGPRFS